MPSFALVMAAYNEASKLRAVFERSLAVLEECTDDYEIVILNDGSTDETGRIADEIRQQHPDVVHLITHETNQGIAATFEELYQAGAHKDYVFDVPADGEFPPEALREIVPMLDRFDVVVCVRDRLKGYTGYRRFVSYFNRMVPQLLFGIDLYDPGSAKCRKREVITEIAVTSQGMYVEQERMIRAARRGFRIGMLSVMPAPREDTSGAGAEWRNVCLAVCDMLVLWVRLIVLRQKP